MKTSPFSTLRKSDFFIVIHSFFSNISNFSLAWGIFLVALTIRLFHLHFFGLKISSDSTYYLKGAEILLHNNFNFFILLEKGYPTYYWVYPAFLALFQNNLLYVAIAQSLLQSIACILLFLIAKRLYGRLVGFFAGLGYAFLWEVFQWDIYILTDSLFLFTIILSCYLALISLEKKQYFYWAAFLLSVCFILLLRPTSFPFLAALLILFTWKISLRYKIFGVFVLLGILCIILAVVFSHDAGSRLGISGYLHYFASLFENGVLVRDRIEFKLEVVWTSGLSLLNIFTFLKIFVSKLILFWSPFAVGFSLAHKIFNFLTFIPLIILGIIGMYYSAAIKKPLNSRFLFFLFSLIIIFWFFQALTEIDYDWRYRLPVLPFLLIFASYGLIKLTKITRDIIT